MHRFKNILFVTSPVEHDEQSLKRAALLAQRNKAKLTVLNTIKNLPDDLEHVFDVVSVKEAEQKMLEVVREYLANWVKENIDVEIEVETDVLIGKHFIEIIRAVLKNQHDLVMKTAEGSIGFKEKLLGSTDMSLIRKCPTPVWLIKPSPFKEYKQIMAAVAPDMHEKDRDSLNDKIMQLATSLSTSEQSKVHVVHAWKMQGETTIESRAASALLSKHDVRDAVEVFRLHREKRLQEILKRNPLTNIEHEIHLVKGDPEEVVPRLAEEKEVELIIMGTIGRTGIPGFLIGNTAEDILNQVDCSVLTVKPAGFDLVSKALLALD